MNKVAKQSILGDHMGEFISESTHDYYYTNFYLIKKTEEGFYNITIPLFDCNRILTNQCIQYKRDMTWEAIELLCKHKKLKTPTNKKIISDTYNVNNVSAKITGNRNDNHIYFIFNGTFIKIGYASNIQNRLNSLQTASPHLLTLIGAMDGRIKDEKLLHKKFKKYHYRGEWFYDNAELRNFIDLLPRQDVEVICHD